MNQDSSGDFDDARLFAHITETPAPSQKQQTAFLPRAPNSLEQLALHGDPSQADVDDYQEITSLLHQELDEQQKEKESLSVANQQLAMKIEEAEKRRLEERASLERQLAEKEELVQSMQRTLDTLSIHSTINNNINTNNESLDGALLRQQSSMIQQQSHLLIDKEKEIQLLRLELQQRRLVSPDADSSTADTSSCGEDDASSVGQHSLLGEQLNTFVQSTTNVLDQQLSQLKRIPPPSATSVHHKRLFSGGGLHHSSKIEASNLSPGLDSQLFAQDGDEVSAIMMPPSAMKPNHEDILPDRSVSIESLNDVSVLGDVRHRNVLALHQASATTTMTTEEHGKKWKECRDMLQNFRVKSRLVMAGVGDCLSRMTGEATWDSFLVPQEVGEEQEEMLGHSGTDAMAVFAALLSESQHTVRMMETFRNQVIAFMEEKERVGSVLNQRLLELETGHASLESDKAMLTAECTQLKTNLEQCQHELLVLKQDHGKDERVRQLQETMMQKESEMNRQREELDRVRFEKEESEKETKNLRMIIDTLRKNEKALESKLQAVTTQQPDVISMPEVDVQKLQHENSELQFKCTHLEKQTAELQAAIHQVVNDKAGFQKYRTELRQTLTKLQRPFLADLPPRFFDSAISTSTEPESHVDMDVADDEAILNEVEKLKQEQADVVAIKSRLEEELSKRIDELTEMNAAKERAEQFLEKARSVIDDHQSREKELLDIVDRLRQEKKQLNDAAEKQQREMDSLQKELTKEKSVSAQLGKLQSSLAKAEKELDSVRGVLRETEADREKLKQSLSEMITAISSKEQENERLLNLKEAAESRLNLLEVRGIELESENARLTKLLDQTRQEAGLSRQTVSQERHAKEELVKQLRIELLKQKKEFDDIVDELRVDLEAAQNELSMKESQLQGSSEMNQNLETEVASKEAAIRAIKSEKAKTEKILSEAQVSLQIMETQLTSLRRQNEKLSSEIQAAESEADERVKLKQMEISKLADQICSLNEKISQQEHQISSLKKASEADLCSVNQQLSKQKEESEWLVREKAELTKELEQKNKELDDYMNTASAAAAELEVQNTKIQMLANEINDFINKEEKLIEELENLKKLKHEIEGINSNLTADNAHLRSTITKLQENAFNENERMKDEREKLRAQFQAKTAEISAARDRYEVVLQAITELHPRMDQCLSQLTTKIQQNDTVYDQFKDKLSGVTQQVQNMANECDSKLSLCGDFGAELQRIDGGVESIISDVKVMSEKLMDTSESASREKLRLEEELSTVRSQLDATVGTIQELNNTVVAKEERLKEVSENLEQQISLQAEQLAALSAENAELSTKLSVQSKSDSEVLKSLKDEIEEKKLIIAKNVEQRDSLTAEITALKAHLADAETNRTTLIDEMNRLKELNCQHEKALEDQMMVIAESLVKFKSQLEDLDLKCAKHHDTVESTQSNNRTRFETELGKIGEQTVKMTEHLKSIEEKLIMKESECEEFQMKVTSLQNDLNALATQKADLESQLESKDEQFYIMKKHADELEQISLEATQSRDELHNTVEKLQTDLSVVKKNAIAQEMEKSEMEHHVKRLKNQIDQTTAELDNARQKLRTVSLEQHELQQSLANSERGKAEMSNTIDELSTSLKEMQDQILSFDDERLESQKSIAELKLDVETKTSQLASIQAKYDALHTQHASLRDKYEVLVHQLSSNQKQEFEMRSEQMQVLEEMQRYKETSASLEREVSSLNTEMQAMSQQLADYTQRTQVLTHEKEVNIKQIASLEQKLDHAAKEFEVIKKKLISSQESLDEKEKLFTALNLKFDAMKTRLDSSFSQLNGHLHFHSESESVVPLLSAFRDFIQSSVFDEEVQNGQFLDSISEFFDEFHRLRSDLQKHVKELAKSRHELDAFQSAYDAKQSACEILEANYRSAQKSMSEMEKNMLVELQRAQLNSQCQYDKLLLEKRLLVRDYEHKLRDQAENVKTAVNERARAEKLLESLRNRLQNLESITTASEQQNADIQSLNNEVFSLRIRVEDLLEQNNSLSEEREKYCQQIRSDSVALGQLQAVNQDLERENNQLHHSLTDTKRSLDASRLMVIFRDRQLANLRHEISSIENECNNLEMIADQMNGADPLSDSIDEQSNSQFILDELQSKLQDEVSMNEKLRQLLDGSEKKQADFEKLLREKRRIIQELEKSNHALKKLVKCQQVTLQKRCEEITTFQEELNSVKSLVTTVPKDHEHTVERLQSRIAELEAQNPPDQSRSADVVRLEEKMHALEEELETKSGEAVLLKLQFDQMKQALDTSQAECKKLSNQLSMVEERSNAAAVALKSELTEMTSQYSQYQKLVEELNETNEELRETVRITEEKCRHQKESLRILEEQRDKLSETLQLNLKQRVQMEKSMETLARQFAELQQSTPRDSVSPSSHPTASDASIKELNQRLDMSEKSRIQLETLLTRIESNLQRKDQQVQELKQQLTSVQMDNLQLLMQQQQQQQSLIQPSIHPSSLIHSTTQPAPPRIIKGDETRPMEPSELDQHPLTASQRTLPEVVNQYEQKLQALQILLEKGEAVLQSGVDIVFRKDQQHHHHRTHRKRRDKLPTTTQRPAINKENLPSNAAAV